jgi:hypothetical protein
MKWRRINYGKEKGDVGILRLKKEGRWGWGFWGNSLKKRTVEKNEKKFFGEEFSYFS